MSGGVEIDDREIRAFLASLTSKQITELYRRGLKKSAFILRKETIQRFSKEYNYKGKWKQKITRKSGKERIKTREVAKVTSKKKGGDIIVKVHIMDDYRVKWLEMGTRNRYTKGRLNVGYSRSGGRKYILRLGKPQRRGRVSEGRFFRAARLSKHKSLMTSIEKNIGDAIKQSYKRTKK